MFLKVFLYFRALSFCLKMYFCVVLQKLLQRHFHEKLATKLFPRKEVKAKTGKHKISDKDFRDYFAAKGFPQKALCFRCVFREYVTSEKLVFSVLYG